MFFSIREAAPPSRFPCTQVSRAKWRPEHPNQIAMAQMPPMRGKDVAIQVHDVNDPSIPLVVVHGGDDQKNGFCWLDTPLLELPPPVVAPPTIVSSFVKLRNTRQL